MGGLDPPIQKPAAAMDGRLKAGHGENLIGHRARQDFEWRIGRPVLS